MHSTLVIASYNARFLSAIVGRLGIWESWISVWNEKFQDYTVRPQFVDALFIVRLISNMSVRRAVIINYLFINY